MSTWSPLSKLGEFGEEVKEVVCTGSARRGERASCRVTMVTIAKRGLSSTAGVNWRASVLSEGIFRRAAHLLFDWP